VYVDSTAAWTAGERGGTIFWYRYLEQRRYKRDLQAEGGEEREGGEEEIRLKRGIVYS
jgi:hypothetical protein